MAKSKASKQLITELERLGYLSSADTLIAELKQLGYLESTEVQPKAKRHNQQFSPEYVAYMKSPEWKARKRRLSPGRFCAGCKALETLELHHTCYPPKGAPLEAFINQPDEDFTWLCKPCHQALTIDIRKRRKQK